MAGEVADVAMEVSVSGGSRVVWLNEVKKTFPNGRTALANVTVSIQEGEFVSLVGPSGCGKSTVLKIVTGLLSPTQGEVWVLGTDPLSARKEGSVGIVFQEATLLPWRTVSRNVELPLELGRVPREERRERARAAIERVGLARVAEALPRQLSGGMRMRVAIARALVGAPRLLLMDEPFGALDEITRQKLHQELVAIWRSSGATVVFVTHNVFEAAFLSTRVLAMGQSGRIIREIPVAEPAPRAEEFRASPAFARVVGDILLSLKEGSE